MSNLELKRGRIYRAKKPANSSGLVNDRQILYIDDFCVQYDGPAVGFGRHYPKVERAKFEAWAGADVTDSLPKGEWASWPPPKVTSTAPAPAVAEADAVPA
jgi:hypothetical protein